MFCNNCGKQINDTARFCDGCGAKIEASNSNNAATQKVDSGKESVLDQKNKIAKNSSKKKTNIIVVLVAVLCAGLIGKFVIAPSLVKDFTKDDGGSFGDDTSTYSANTDYGDVGINNSTNNSIDSKYEQILTEAYIAHFPNVFGVGTSTASFALKEEQGVIYCVDYAYKDDVVRQYVETMYIPLANVDDSKKAQMESVFKAEFATVEALDCCTASYKMSANYFTITLNFTDVDKAENYSALYQTGIAYTNGPISMSATESDLIARGAAKK